MVDAKEWCERAIQSTSTLWDKNRHHAWRTSESIMNVNDSEYFPTATFHAIAAFGECGIWDSEAFYDEENNILRTPYLEINDFFNYSRYEDVLKELVNSPPGSDNWVHAKVSSSSHSRKPGQVNTQPDKDYWPRQALVIGRLFHALRILITYGKRDKDKIKKDNPKYPLLEDLFAKVLADMETATDFLFQVVSKKHVFMNPTSSEFQDVSEDLSTNPFVSPYVLLQVAIGLVERETILSLLGVYEDSEVGAITKYKKVILQYFVREIDRLMSRRQIPLSPDYDAASLAFSIHGRILMEPSFREKPLFNACIEAVVNDQHADGSWPDGRSATFDDTGTSIQQPSVAIALSLAECIFRPELLINATPNEINLLKKGIEALRKTSQNLAASFNKECRNNGNLEKHQKRSGWVSDRVRWPQVSETWITAMAARLFHVLWLSERACARFERLLKYKVHIPKDLNISAQQLINPLSSTIGKESNIVEKWQKEVIEPDNISKPAEILSINVLKPIQNLRSQGAYFLRPQKNGVSFIVFGPPGSGKTYFVKTFAETLGWPLLTINPGHFIHKGLEFIEATSSEIFSDLMRLDHTVVFFDECDELFLERSNQPATRNILSFATASMLPKLQDLHDARRVIFFLGTNYLSNVDTAIRREGRFDFTLLFDRPDAEARKEFIRREWEKRNKNLLKDEASLDAAANETIGWSVSDILSYAKSKASGGDLPSPNIDDYINWCVDKEKGPKELNNSRILQDNKKEIAKRWKEIVKHYKKNGQDLKKEKL